MKQAALALFAALVLASTTTAWSAEPDTQTPPELVYLDHSDVSPPLRDMPPIPVDWDALSEDLHEVKTWPHQHPPRELGAIPDPVVQAPEGVLPAVSATVGLNFDGVGTPNYAVIVAPPDTVGAVGDTQYVQWVNTAFAVFDKNTGGMVYGPVQGNTLWQGFGGHCESDNNGDPMVNWDRISHRWILSQFAISSAPYYQCIAVSTTADATGSYRRFAYQFTNFNDYPKGAVWSDGYYITYNMFLRSATGVFTGVGPRVCAYDRAQMVSANGAPGPQVCFQLNTTYFGLLPSDLDGSTLPPAGAPNYVTSFDDAGLNGINLWRFRVNWTTPSLSTLSTPTKINTAAFTEACDGGVCITQPGTTQKLASLGDRLMFRLVYRNFGDHEALVVNHSVDVNGHSGVRWYEIRDPGGTPTVFQQATFSPDNNHRWMGSIAMDQAGNMLLGYSVSGSLKPAIRITGRLATDALNKMQAETSILAGAGVQSGTTRWGDYSAMTIDPLDDCTFWYTQQYLKANGSFNWSTRIASFKFPSCGSGSPPPAIVVTVSPKKANVRAGGQQLFSAVVQNAPNASVTWSREPADDAAGAIDQSGVYTAPAVITSVKTVTVVATSNADNRTTDTATVMLGEPAARLSTTTLTFPDQVVATVSAPQHVTLTSVGTLPLSITDDIRIEPIGSDFAQTNDCPTSLAIDAFCTIDVTFKPTDVGLRKASLIVPDNASGTPHTVDLSGTGKYACKTKCRIVGRPTSTIHVGESITLTAPEVDPSFAYAWYKGDLYDIAQPLSSGPTLTDTPPLGITSYWVRTFTDAARTRFYDSEVADITVITAEAVIVDISPSDASIEAGVPVHLSARVGYPATFQWYQGPNYTNSAPIPGAIGVTLEVSPMSDTRYWVRATEPAGTQHDSPIIVVRVGCGAGPVVGITSQPMIPIVARPDTAYLIANGTGKDVKYVWFTGETGDTSHFRASGPTIGVIAIDPVQTFWVRATDACGRYYDSHAASVYACLPRITSQPLADQPTIPADGSLTARIHVDAVSSNTVAPHYQWYRDNPGALPISIPNSDSPDLTVGASQAGTYWVDAIGTCSETLQSRATSDRVTVGTCTPPVVTTGWFPPSVERSAVVTLAVQASGDDLTFQWYRGASGDLSSPIEGALESTYSFMATANGSYWVLVKSHGACASASATMSVAVCDKPFVSAPTAAAPEVMPGTSTTISVTATGSNLNYQWRQAPAAGGASQPVGTNASVLTTAPLNQDTTFWVNVSSGSCSRQSPYLTVPVCNMSVHWTTPVVPPAHSGDTILIGFSASPAPGNNAIAYWYRGTPGDLAHSVLISGPTTATTMVVNPTATTTYWVRLSSTKPGSSCRVDTGGLVVRVCLPRIVQQPASIMVDPGTPTTLSVAVDVTPATYQWYAGVSGDTATPIAGATAASLNITPSATTSYWARVTGDCAAAVDSDAATVTVAQPTAIVTQPADTSITVPGSAFFTVAATGTSLAYQWYQGTAGNTSIPTGDNTATLLVTPATPTDYWVRVTGARGVVNSRTAHVSVCSTPVITAQPLSQTIFSGAAAALSVSATELTGEPKHYQWFRGTGISDPVGTDSSSYNTGALTATTQFRVRVTAGMCLANSALATVSMCTLPQTTGAAANQQIAMGGTARLTAPVTPATGRSFRWYRGASGDTSAPLGSWLVGNMFDVSPTVTTTYWYQVQDSGGCLSNGGTSTVSVCIPHITQQPSGTTIAAGSSTTLSVVSDLPAATYQWFAGASGDTASPVAGGTSATLAVSPTATRDYWVRVSGPCGQSVDSAAATVTVCAPPVITAQPVDPPAIPANYGQVVQVVASGTNLTYQWYLGQTGDLSSPVGGATDAMLTLFSVPYTQYYWVRIGGTCGSVDSRAVAISVNPTLSQQPGFPSVMSGSSATLSVRASGTYLHYQWKNVGTGQVVGTDSSVLMTPPITAQSRFNCFVSSGTNGLAISQPGTVSLCTGIVSNGVTVGAADPNSGCRWLTLNATTQIGDGIAWYRGASGDVSTEVVGARGSRNLLACPADAGSYWYRITRGTCSKDSPAVTAP